MEPSIPLIVRHIRMLPIFLMPYWMVFVPAKNISFCFLGDWTQSLCKTMEQFWSCFWSLPSFRPSCYNVYPTHYERLEEFGTFFSCPVIHGSGWIRIKHDRQGSAQWWMRHVISNPKWCMPFLCYSSVRFCHVLPFKGITPNRMANDHRSYTCAFLL